MKKGLILASKTESEQRLTSDYSAIESMPALSLFRDVKQPSKACFGSTLLVSVLPKTSTNRSMEKAEAEAEAEK